MRCWSPLERVDCSDDRHRRGAAAASSPILGCVNGSPNVIEFLNEALTAELTAINQYYAAAKIAEHKGWSRIAEKFREESMGEMRDADKLMERILLLDGHPNLQRLGTVGVGETIPEQLELDRSLEASAVEMYRRGVKLDARRGRSRAAASCSSTSSSAKRSTSTGSRPSSRSSRRSASSSTSRPNSQLIRPSAVSGQLVWVSST